MDFGFEISGHEYVALGWQSEGQLWYAKISYFGTENRAYMGQPEIMYFRDFIYKLSKGELIISRTLPVLT